MKSVKRALSIALVMILTITTVFAMDTCAFASTNPPATSITSLSSKTNSISVKWKKKSNITGYQIQYSTNSNYKSAKTIKIKSSKTTSKTISKLKSGKRYYVRIRTYKTVKSKNHYSSWSKSKNISTKSSSTSNSKTVYITPTGKRYHYDNHCNGGTYIKSTLKEAKARGLTPCQKCCQ